jgi:hypothetical protein
MNILIFLAIALHFLPTKQKNNKTLNSTSNPRRLLGVACIGVSNPQVVNQLFAAERQ